MTLIMIIGQLLNPREDKVIDLKMEIWLPSEGLEQCVQSDSLDVP